jgi:hypothetical protein
MEIKTLFSNIRSSNIGNILYKVKSNSNFCGVFGLKIRPPDTEFLETGDAKYLDTYSVVKKSQNYFRKIIPKDYVVISLPTSYILNENGYTTYNQYQLIDVDIYAYLLVAKAISTNQIPAGSNPYTNLFYIDGRRVDYSDKLLKNIFSCSAYLSEESVLIPYMYKKLNSDIFLEANIEDFLSGSFSVCLDKENPNYINEFLSIDIFSNIEKSV